ncbi:MAG: hypothetical protein U0802_20335 [Candidatus Binatia bacterium]
MPAYPDLTVAQLQDLVAFLASLTAGGGAVSRAGGGIAGRRAAASVGRGAGGADPGSAVYGAPSVAATLFLVQTYDVLPERLAASSGGSSRRSPRAARPAAASSASRRRSTAPAAVRR